MKQLVVFSSDAEHIRYEQRKKTEPKITGFVWDVGGERFVHIVELPEWKRIFIECLLQEHETDGESYPLM